MIEFIEARELIAGLPPEDECLRQCGEAIRVGEARNVEPGPGRMTVCDALATFGIRKQTAQAAGIETCGLDSSLEQLGRRAQEEVVLLFHFATADWYFTVFISERDRSVIGCVRVKAPS